LPDFGPWLDEAPFAFASNLDAPSPSDRLGAFRLRGIHFTVVALSPRVLMAGFRNKGFHLRLSRLVILATGGPIAFYPMVLTRCHGVAGQA